MAQNVDLYSTYYGNFGVSAQDAVRRETYGEDIGQSSWITADEYRLFFQWLGLTADMHVLDVASGSGGPALFMARTVGCRVTGIDINPRGIATANELSAKQGLDQRVRFRDANATESMPFEDASFDALVCIDALCHFSHRDRMFREWQRTLRPGGKALVTDPVVVTGLVSKDELAVRSSTGHFVFAPPGENERLLKAAGLELLRCEDMTSSTVQISKRWHDARDRHREELIGNEGKETFDGLQRFLTTVHLLTSEHRLARFVYLAGRPVV